MPVIVICAYPPCSKPFPAASYQAKSSKFCAWGCYRAMRADPAVQRAAFAKRFWSKVAIAGPDECWPWQAALHGQGYGNFRATPYHQGNVSAHIVSWFLTQGTWPPDRRFVCHSCDVPACVAPHHLWLGTHSDNMQDCIRKRRNGMVTMPERAREGLRRYHQAHPLRPEISGDRNGMRLHPEAALRGDKNPRSKITETQVQEAWHLYTNGDMTLQQLGDRYGVTGQAIRYRIGTCKPSND